MSRPRILMTVPNGDCYVHKHVVMAVVRILADPRCETRLMLPTWVPYEHNLNRCAAQAIDDEVDYWLSIDTDNPPLGNPLDRVFDDLDLVGFPTPVWHDKVRGDRPWYFNALSWTNADNGGWRPYEPCVGLHEVDAIGSGCFLVASRVLRTVSSPWFMREYDERGFVVRGHDYLFSAKVRECGFHVWADFDCVCQHFCELEILSVVESFAAMNHRHGGDRDRSVSHG